MLKIKFNIEKFKKSLPTIKYILIGLVLILLIGIFGIAKKQKPAPQPTPTPVAQAAPKYTDFHLEIPSLNINAPIIADVDGNDKTAYFKSLEGGVAHFRGTAKPGENSNTFIFGHSSYYWWAAGDYKTIFSTLPDIKEGDEIDVWYQEKEFKYKVSETQVVDPTDVDVLKPTSSEQLTLMTCVPVGTDKERLIVIAKPI